MTECNWIIEDVFQRTEELVSEIEKQGGKVILLSPDKIDTLDPPEEIVDECINLEGGIIYRGSIDCWDSWIKEAVGDKELLYREEDSEFVQLYGHWQDAVLNVESRLTPAGMALYLSRKSIEEGNESHKTFLKANRGSKVFEGGVYTLAEIERILRRLDPAELVVISEPKKIELKYRLLIRDRKVIDCCEYQSPYYDTRSQEETERLKLSVRSFVSKKLEKINQLPSRLYFLDACLTTGGDVKVLGYKSFATSEVYNLDLKEIVKSTHMVVADRIATKRAILNLIQRLGRE